MSDIDLKEQIIDKIFAELQALGDTVRNSGEFTPMQQLPQVNVLVDTMKFLQDYDENILVLNRYWSQKRGDPRFNRTQGEIDR